MSGDLENAGRSLPRGTFAAVGLSVVVYVGVALVFAGVLDNATLVSDYGAMRRIAPFPWLIDAGVIAATLSSALASFLGAPRILQSLAADRVFPVLGPFAAGHGPTRNPRRGVLLSAAIAYGTIALGDLNVIAPVVSMFFLISYGLLNYATFVEARANSPSFRPRFRWFHERLSLAGGLGCLGAMIAIEPTAAVVAVVLLFAVYHYVASSGVVDRWADSGRSHRFQRMRRDLRAIAAEPEHPRYWRPLLLAFSDDAVRRLRLLRFAHWLEGGSGMTTVVRLIEGEGPRTRRLRGESEAELRTELAEKGLPAFPRVIVAPDTEAAVPVLLQAYGLGPVRANTVLLNWLDREEAKADPLRAHRLGRRLRLGLRFGCNLILLDATDAGFERVAAIRPHDRTIDVWYRDNATGRLSLLLAYLMTRTQTWEDARIRLFVPGRKDESAWETLARTERMLDDVRIVAEAEVMEQIDTRTIAEHSLRAAVVFLPMTLSDGSPGCVYGSADELLPALGLSALVLATEDLELDAAPEEGSFGEIAQALDAERVAAKAAKRSERDASKAAEAAREARERLEGARAENAEPERLGELEGAARTAEQQAERTRRRAARARAKADAAAAAAEGLGGKRAGRGKTAPDGDEPAHEEE